jgi:dUTP pyrophosphatase
MEYVKIKSIKKTESEPIYHLRVKNNHNFFGNRLCLHNCDYYGNKSNDGNIIVCLRNIGSEIVYIDSGEKICQGIFTKFLTVDNEQHIHKTRTGGYGSTGTK